MNDGDMQDYPPQRMMRGEELSQARRVLRNLDRLYAESRTDEELPTSQRKDYEYFRERRRPLNSELDALCAEVWKREVGLERCTVLHVRRPNSEVRFQLLSFSVHDHSGWPGGWMWVLDGRALRKNGTLGSKPVHSGFRVAHLMRRHLDGSWRELRWPAEQGE